MGKGDFNRGTIADIFDFRFFCPELPKRGDRHWELARSNGKRGCVIVVPGARLEHNRPTIPFRIEVAA